MITIIIMIMIMIMICISMNSRPPVQGQKPYPLRE